MLFSVLVVTLSIILASSCHAWFIADSRDHNPNVGRGYSTSSSAVFSTCLTFKEKTEPTYNYDYDLMEINYDDSISTTSSASFQASLSYSFISASVSVSANSKSSRKKKSSHLVAKMSMERYYSSIDDTTATLTPDALSLLREKNDIVGFFQSCGSGYIRSIRRTAEITAIFTFESSSETSLKSLSADLKVKLKGFGVSAGAGTSMSMASESASSDSTMHIVVKAFGLGLNMNGSDTLVARSVEDYQNAMNFAFKSMQHDNVGMIRGVEVVPWVDNLQFQNAINLQAVEEILLPQERLALEKEKRKALESEPAETKEAVQVYFDSKMYRQIESVELKAITTTNAEFIAEMDKWYRNEMYLILLMRNCKGELSLLYQVESLRNNVLINHKEMEKGTHLNPITVSILTEFLTNERMVQKFSSVRNFITGFFAPCTTAIQHFSNGGRMTRYFWDITECKFVQCLKPNQYYTISVTGQFSCHDSSLEDSATTTNDANLSTFSLDEVLEKYCLPEINYSIPPVISLPNQTVKQGKR